MTEVAAATRTGPLLVPYWRLLSHGVLLPVVCLLVDPGLMRTGWNPPFAPLWLRAIFDAWFAAAVLALVAGLFLLRPGRRAAFLAGGLWAGVMGATALGVAIAPLTIVGMLFVVPGLLGLSPFFAARAYATLARHLSRLGPRPRGWTSAGFLCGVDVPIAAGVAVQLRAPVALRQLLAAPGHGVRRELRAYQLLFDLDDVATRIHSGLCEQRDEFEQACFDLGIHVIED